MHVPSSSPPPALYPGCHVALIAPSSPFDREAFDRGAARLGERYDVTWRPDIFASVGHLAGDDERRREELLAALDDPSVRGIVAVRGGYGATRLLDTVDAERVRDAGKALVGFSDLTALHALWARAGVRSVHGAMVGALGRTTDAAFERWVAVLEGAVPPAIEGLRTLAPGTARGTLLGGNLSVLAALAGTPYAPPLDGALLFLEDIGEPAYRIDRMLTTLLQAGWLDRVRGVALGMFNQRSGEPAGPPAPAIEAVLRERLGPLGVPVASGIPAGHIESPVELPLGASATLDASTGTLRFHEAATFGPSAAR
ncbi:MAG: LD-carboxypeptidase [Myxococcales bacterium]|nr:LD-carboxypeptidase [Myxococcales bacterium]